MNRRANKRMQRTRPRRAADTQRPFYQFDDIGEGNLMVRKVNALKVRQNLGQLLEEVWQERRARFFGMVDELRRKGKQLKPEAVEREVADAVRAVRAKAQS